MLGINFYKGIVFNFMAQSSGSQREYVKGHLSVSTQCNEGPGIRYVPVGCTRDVIPTPTAYYRDYYRAFMENQDCLLVT